MIAAKWWCAPIDIGDGLEMTHRLDKQFPNMANFANAESLTVRLRGIMVHQSYDRTGWQAGQNNDLMVLTSSQFGNEPPIQRLHFMQDNVPVGWQTDFFNDVVLAIQGVDDRKRQLTLRVQVYDLDRYDAELLGQIKQASQSVAVSFPPLANYAAAVSFGSAALMKLVDMVDNHDRILEGGQTDCRAQRQGAKRQSSHRFSA